MFEFAGVGELQPVRTQLTLYVPAIPLSTPKMMGARKKAGLRGRKLADHSTAMHRDATPAQLERAGGTEGAIGHRGRILFEGAWTRLSERGHRLLRHPQKTARGLGVGLCEVADGL